MRIALVSSLHPYRGGIARFNTCLANALHQQGHRVCIYNFTRQYPSWLFPGKTQLVEEGEPNRLHEAIPCVRLLDCVNPFSWIRTARRITQNTPEVVLMRYWTPFLAPCLGAVARLTRFFCGRRQAQAPDPAPGKALRPKFIALVDNAIPHEPKPYDKPLSRFFLRSFQGYVVMSHTVANDLEALLGAPPKAVLYKPHPLYNDYGPRLPRPQALDAVAHACERTLDPHRKTLLFFGLIRPYKGLDLLLEALPYLDDSYQLIIAGECYGSFQKYQDLIDASPLKSQIYVCQRFIGEKDLPAFFSAAHVCVQPYRSATQSGITAVAYAYGVPLITTPVGGLYESIGLTGTGLLAESITPQAIAQAIKDYFSQDPAPFREAIEKQKECLSWPRFAQDFVHFINHNL